MSVLSGVVPVVPTPFVDLSEEVDVAALRDLIDFAVQAEVSAVCLPAYGSEFYKLTDQERIDVIEAAVSQAAGRLSVVAQCNHGSAKVAASFAARSVRAGAAVISVALPRQFVLTESDLLAYACTVCDAVDVPVLVQDWNPAGQAVGPEFCTKLADACPNFCYIKLEEPRMGPKVRTIAAATAGRVGVFEGWGGLYMLELAPAGVVGVMPGLSLADRLVQVWRMAASGSGTQALELFEPLVPWLGFALSDMEFFNAFEKRLLVARGVLASATMRSPTITVDPDTLRYGDLLMARLLDDLERPGHGLTGREMVV